MNKELILQMQSQFDALTQTHPDAFDLEFWFARDLQEPLGYARWENFLTAIKQAIESCKTTGYEVGYHFLGVTKMITLGKRKPMKRSRQSRPAIHRIRHLKYESRKSHYKSHITK